MTGPSGAGASTAVIWFRRDLRLADNPALRTAVDGHDRLVALFVHDPALARPSGANRLAFLHGCLDALDADLEGHLLERAGDPVAVVPRLAAEVGAGTVYAAEDFGPHGGRRDDAVEAALAAAGRRLERVGSPYAVPPATVFTGGGTPFRVFTPFSKAWRAHGWDDPVGPPDRIAWLTGRSAPVGDPRPPTPAPEAAAGLPEPGERAARGLAAAFLDGGADRYADDRDRPDLDATSHLSPHLKWGTIHPRQLLAGLAPGPGAGRGDGRGATTFASELCWREFYADVLFHRPDTVRANFVGTLDRLRWDTGPVADERFEAWCAGRTGYPIVDAGMRQLLAEGWIHNRVRMITASFLVKDLHVDWRRGAAWFLRHLVDADLASNQHGWQWVAGTGTDAAPFFRIFNPTTQGLRFDPAGDYVRRHVPELRSVPGRAVHEPWKLAADLFAAPAADYPVPIVDHAAERDEALARYHAR